MNRLFNIKYLTATAVFTLIGIVSLSAFKTETKNHKTNGLYWYQVIYDAGHPNGYIPNSASYYTQAEQKSVESPCMEGTDRDCLRGFDAPLSVFPNDNLSTPKIMRAE